LKWAFKWRKELKSGQYYDLLFRGFIKSEDTEPTVEGFEFYIEAFWELSSSRPVAMEIGPIPFTAIADYFKIYEIEQDFDEFSYIIRLMDSTFRELNSESRRTEMK